MIDADTLSALQSIAASLQRLADRHAPVEEPRQKREATLSTAIYDREDRQRQELRKALRQQEPQPPR